MKTFIGALILIILVISFSFYSVSYLEETTLKMISLVDGVEKFVQSSNWESAETALKDSMEEWKQRNFMLRIFIEHKEIDQVDMRLAYLKSYIETRSLVEARAELNALFGDLEGISQSEKLTIQNIL